MPVTCPSPWLGSMAVGGLRLGFCFGGFAGNDAVDAIAIDLLGFERETELLAHDAREEPTHRMLLPAGCHRDGGNRRSLGLAQQRNHDCLLGIRARCRGASSCRLMGLARWALASRASIEFLYGLVAWHVGILSSLVDGILCRRTAEAPQ